MKRLLCTLVLIVCGSAQASEKGNGGDICENRFKIVRDDLSSWISRGGSAALNLGRGTAHADYFKEMQSAIDRAKITCLDEQVLVRGTVKSCKNFYNSAGRPEIVCNENRFMRATESDQYVLVHHEFAGLAGFETTTTSGSNYAISNQITSYLKDQVVKKLVVKERSTSDRPGYVKIEDEEIYKALWQQLSSIPRLRCTANSSALNVYYGEVKMSGADLVSALQKYGYFYRKADGSPVLTNFAFDGPDYKVTFVLTLDAGFNRVIRIDHYTSMRKPPVETRNAGTILSPNFSAPDESMIEDHNYCLLQ